MTDTEPTQYVLTTVDNPFNPITEFDQWFQWDVSAGYNTAALLARITKSSTELSEPDQALAIQQAIDEIVEENVSGMHRKIAVANT
jgi:arsenate reductase-like glutaredoxin family protein